MVSTLLFLLSARARAEDPLLTHLGAAAYLGAGSPGQSLVGGRVQLEGSHLAVGFSLGAPLWSTYGQVNALVVGQGSIPWVRLGRFGGAWDFNEAIGTYALVGTDLCNRHDADDPYLCLSVGVGGARVSRPPTKVPLWRHAGEIYPAVEVGLGYRIVR